VVDPPLDTEGLEVHGLDSRFPFIVEPRVPRESLR
jgi:hypothetical protein